jgi:outer membrane protein assembly factor BamA
MMSGIGVSDRSAQTANRLAPQTRAGQIEIAREQKAASLRPEENSHAEHVLQTVEDKKVIQRVFGGVAGWRLKLGGMIVRSGFAAGPEYVRRFDNDQVRFYASIRASTRHYYLMETGLNMPHLASDRLFANLSAVHYDYPSVEYYGPGPNSYKHGRSDYLLENTSLQGHFGVEPLRRLRVGAIGSFTLINVGPGRDAEFASTDHLYTEAVTPGIQQQSNFLQGGGFLQLDLRDKPLFPHSGEYYAVQFTTNDALDGAYSFQRLDLEAQQYLPFFNDRRTIALRGRIQAADPLAGSRVPFYLQPTLGGDDDLRGFRPFRFYDNASAVINAEYRWQIFYGMEMALFVDAGKVFDRLQQINFRRLEKDAGLGWRFNMSDAVFMRIDAGFSREGFGVWLKFGNVF